jgi:hypothetical protein
MFMVGLWLPVETDYVAYMKQADRERRYREMEWRIRQLDQEIEQQYRRRQHAQV